MERSEHLPRFCSAVSLLSFICYLFIAAPIVAYVFVTLFSFGAAPLLLSIVHLVHPMFSPIACSLMLRVQHL